ncbi:hypothetical protein CVT24_005859 [Panaeolus cyanescens]|uniref:Uncharacterized protein n=1 Tax=Panaeolus cyanescens TaxID=181874 RepID=A0A409YF04_9AGAR|nr:hypothetical protein CVT24_005859 [Panaeolus cyanescens]
MHSQSESSRPHRFQFEDSAPEDVPEPPQAKRKLSAVETKPSKKTKRDEDAGSAVDEEKGRKGGKKPLKKARDEDDGCSGESEVELVETDEDDGGPVGVVTVANMFNKNHIAKSLREYKAKGLVNTRGKGPLQVAPDGCIYFKDIPGTRFCAVENVDRCPGEKCQSNGVCYRSVVGGRQNQSCAFCALGRRACGIKDHKVADIRWVGTNNTTKSVVGFVEQSQDALTKAVEAQTGAINNLVDAVNNVSRTVDLVGRHVEMLALIKAGLEGIPPATFYDDKAFSKALVSLARQPSAVEASTSYPLSIARNRPTAPVVVRKGGADEGKGNSDEKLPKTRLQAGSKPSSGKTVVEKRPVAGPSKAMESKQGGDKSVESKPRKIKQEKLSPKKDDEGDDEEVDQLLATNVEN